MTSMRTDVCAKIWYSNLAKGFAVPAPDVVRELVKRFEDNLESYRSSRYNETQLRREFLDPLFEALGWDVFNKAGYAEAYKTFIQTRFDLLKLHKSRLRKRQDKERVRREIENTDKQIDRLVYILSHKGIRYGLSDDEVKVVEGKE